MIELTKASLVAKHSTQLYEASQNRWKPNDTWESTTTLQNIELSSPSVSEKFATIEFEYDSKMSSMHDSSAVHSVLTKSHDDLVRNLDVYFNSDVICEKYKRAYKRFKRWKRGSSKVRCYMCKGLNIPKRIRTNDDDDGDEFDKFIVHADRNYPIGSEVNVLRQSTIPIFSVIEAKIYNLETKLETIQVVRVMAILQFTKIDRDDEIICVVAPMETDPKSTTSSLIPFDIYQYLRDPVDNAALYITCCHASSLLRPVFCMAKDKPPDLQNCVSCTEYGRNNDKRQQFYVITMKRWFPTISEGRTYESFYSSRTRNKSSWSAFNKEEDIKEFKKRTSAGDE